MKSKMDQPVITVLVSRMTRPFGNSRDPLSRTLGTEHCRQQLHERPSPFWNRTSRSTCCSPTFTCRTDPILWMVSNSPGKLSSFAPACGLSTRPPAVKQMA